jgi:hypothetical protein
VIKSRIMRWEKHVARMAEMRNAYKIAVRKPEGKIIDGKVPLKWFVKNRVRRCGLDSWTNDELS